jgi:hypothetical protein
MAYDHTRRTLHKWHMAWYEHDLLISTYTPHVEYDMARVDHVNVHATIVYCAV